MTRTVSDKSGKGKSRNPAAPDWLKDPAEVEKRWEHITRGLAAARELFAGNASMFGVEEPEMLLQLKGLKPHELRQRHVDLMFLSSALARGLTAGFDQLSHIVNSDLSATENARIAGLARAAGDPKRQLMLKILAEYEGLVERGEAPTATRFAVQMHAKHGDLLTSERSIYNALRGWAKKRADTRTA